MEGHLGKKNIRPGLLPLQCLCVPGLCGNQPSVTVGHMLLVRTCEAAAEPGTIRIDAGVPKEFATGLSTSTHPLVLTGMWMLGVLS